MIQLGDQANIEAMQTMRNAMTSPEAAQAWRNEKRAAFEARPNDQE